MKKTIIAIVGRNSSGKSAIARRIAEKYGLKIVQSYTTRSPRPSEIEKGLENSDHIFVTDDEFDKLTDIVAYTEINGVRYCTTEDVLNNSDIYVIDPKGIDYLLTNFGKKYHLVQFLIRANDDVRKTRFMSRGETEEAFDNRNQSENSQFSEYDDNHGYDIVIYNNNELETAVDDISDYIEILLENLQAEKEFIEKQQEEKLASDEKEVEMVSNPTEEILEDSMTSADIRADNETDTDLVLDKKSDDIIDVCENDVANVDESNEDSHNSFAEEENANDSESLSHEEDVPFDMLGVDNEENSDIVIDPVLNAEDKKEESLDDSDVDSAFDMFKLDELDSFEDEDFEDSEEFNDDETDMDLEEKDNTSSNSGIDMFSLDDDFESEFFEDETEEFDNIKNEDDVKDEMSEESTEEIFDLKSLIKDDDDDDDDDDSPDEAILLD